MVERGLKVDYSTINRWVICYAPERVSIPSILHLALLFILGGVPTQITVRQIKYLNNIVKQDHRFVKKITKSMKGFKAF